MAKVKEILTHMKNEWTHPKIAVHSGIETPFKLSCSFNSGAKSHDLSAIEEILPLEAKELYMAANGANLFKDDEYSQWGIKLFSLDEIFNATTQYFEERYRDSIEGDLIIGEFFGDSDLILLRCNSENSDFGSVIIVSAIDSRSEWSIAAKNIEIFLIDLYSHQGEKFWEKTSFMKE